MDNVYIGARYVPKFDGAYDPTKEYEPLTIVTYESNSYTSKRAVPANTFPTNDTYWAETGNFNAQVQDLSDAVNELNNNTIPFLQSEIEAIGDIPNILDNKRILIVGDSISDLEHFPNCWVKNFKEYCDELDNVTVDTFAINGEAFSGVSGIAASWVSSTVSGEGYDYIIFIIGMNDWGAQVPIGNYASDDYTTFIGSINKVHAHIMTNYPNAKVFWASIIPTFFDSAVIAGRKIVKSFYNAAILSRAQSFNNYMIDLSCGIPSYRDGLTLDHLHPNSDGAALINEFIILNLNAPQTDIGDKVEYTDYTVSDTGISGNIRLYSDCHGKLLFNINVSATSAPVAGSNVAVIDDVSIQSYLQIGLLFAPVLWQSAANQICAFLEYSDKLYLSAPEGITGRWIGDTAYQSAIMQTPDRQ